MQMCVCFQGGEICRLCDKLLSYTGIFSKISASPVVNNLLFLFEQRVKQLGNVEPATWRIISSYS